MSDKVHPAIKAIDAIRGSLGITHAEFCRMTELDEKAWRRLRRGRQRPRSATLARLNQKIGFIRVAKELEVREMGRVYFHVACFRIFHEQEDLGREISQHIGGGHARLLRFARALPVFLLHVQQGYNFRHMATALGVTRRRVRRAVREVGDLPDALVDRLVEKITLDLRLLRQMPLDAFQIGVRRGRRPPLLPGSSAAPSWFH